MIFKVSGTHHLGTMVTGQNLITIIYHIIPYLLRFFSKSHKCQTAGGDSTKIKRLNKNDPLGNLNRLSNYCYNNRVWLMPRLNEMGPHHPITVWYLNEKHTSIKPCRGGTFFVSSPQRHGRVEEKVGGWVDSWINMGWRCVKIGDAPRHITYSSFWLPLSEPDQEFAHFKQPQWGSFSLHRENETKQRPDKTC